MKTAKIELLDETNCKIHNLDTSTRRKLYDKFSFMLPHAYHVPAYKMGRWDGKVQFFQLGGKTFINLLEEILPILIAEGYEVSLDDCRERYKIDLKPITIDHFKDRLWPEGHPVAGQPVILRDYQLDVINNFITNEKAVQVVGTGAGKTIVTAALSDLVEKSITPEDEVMQKITSGRAGARTIVIVPNKDLVTQTEEDYINLGLDVGVYYGDRKDVGKTHTICTWQSLEVMRKNFQEGKSELSLEEFIEGVYAVIVDECLDGDTLILTPDGEKKISNLQPGDKIINLDEKTLTYKEDTIVKVHNNLTKSESEDMLELEFDDNSKIRVTANHEFLVENIGWVRADQITNEMEIIDIHTYAKR